MLTHMEKMRLYLAPPWPESAPFHGDERTCRDFYQQHRAELLVLGNWGPLGCQPFWQFEGPPECRDDTEPALAYVDGGVEAYERLEQRRLAWLLGPGRPLFEDWPNGEALYARLRERAATCCP